ncbi:MAG TPA: DinB family protein [Acidimicrobiales bacterium]|nr:DinB family protein [Acidimicrobiales bacterium]
MTTTHGSQERVDIAGQLAKQRGFLRYTVQGLTDEQASSRPTPSELCLAGIIKHVARVEKRWTGFIVNGSAGMNVMSPESMQEHAASFQVQPGETLAGLLDAYDEVARETDKLVYELESLDVSQSLPDAPWFEPGSRWTARQVFLHIIGETAQHSGHADIIREAIDGAKTMG